MFWYMVVATKIEGEAYKFVSVKKEFFNSLVYSQFLFILQSVW